MDKRCIFALLSGFLLRLFLFAAFPSLPDLLGHRVEISTPVTSFKRLQEGHFLYTHGLSPYDGGVYHQVRLLSKATLQSLIESFKAPLLLAFFSSIPASTAVINLVYILADISSALSLVEIAQSGVSAVSRLHTSNRKELSWPAWAVAAG